MLKANTGQEKSDESPVKGEAGREDHGSNELAEQSQGQKDTEEHATQSDQSAVLQDPGQSNLEESSQGSHQTAEKQNIASDEVCSQDASESKCEQDTPDHTERREADGKIASISDTMAELEDGKIVQETPPVTSELSEIHVNTTLPEEAIVPANQEKSDPCESTASLDAVHNDSECAVPHQMVDDAATHTVERVEQPNETVSESGKPEICDSAELTVEPSGLVSDLTQTEAVEDSTVPAAGGITASSELPSVSDEKSAVSAVAVSSESPLPDSQSNGCIEEVEPAGDQKSLVDYQLERNEALTVDPFSYTATYDSDASQVDSTNQLNQSQEELSGRPPGDISGDPPDGVPEFSDPSVYMMEDASEPVLDDGKVSVQGGHQGHSADSLHDMGAQGVTLSIPEDSVLTNDPPMGDATLMAPGIETDGNPGTRVLLLQRQTDDGSLVQEYVEVPNVTDGDGNLIVYDEMGNQYIIPPSQADADPPMAEEVITNETEVVTTGEDHLMHDGLVLDDVELPVAQESPDDSSDHVVVERLQYQDVSYMPSHARNEVQMSVEIGEDEEDSEGEIGHDYINNDVNHVVVHHSELLDHDLEHSDLPTAVSFDTHPLGELPIVPQGSATSKKRKRQMDRVGFDGKPAPVRKRKKKPKIDEMKDLSGAPLKVTNNFMEPLATSTGTLSFPHHPIGGSNFRSSVMPVSPIRIPVPEMSEDSKDCSHRKVRTTSGSSLLGSPTLQPPETPTSQKSHSPIQNKHPTIASLLFKGSTSVSPAVSPRSSSSSPFSATAMVSPNLPSMMSPSLPSMTSPNGSVFHGNTAPMPSVSSQDNAKSAGGVVEQVCKMLPVRPPGWQPQYTTAQQRLPYVKTVTSAVTDTQDLSHTKTRDNFQNALAVHEIMTVPNMPPAAVGAPVVSSTAPILKIPVPEFRGSGPHQPISAPMPHQKLDQDKSHTKVAEVHRPVYDPRNPRELSSVRHPQPVQGPFIPTSNQGTLIQQKPARPTEQEKVPIVITPVEERLPPPYPGHSQANKPTAPLPESGPHARRPVPVTAAQSSGLVMVSTEKHMMEPPVPVPSSVAPSSSGSQQASQAMKTTVPVTSVPQCSANGPIQIEVPRTAADVRPVRLPVQAILPHGKVPPLMFPPGVLPPPHLIRGVPPGHAVPIELVRGQRPAFISPTGHILIPTDQLHLLQQGRLIPRPMMHGPPQFVRPQVPLSAASPQPIRPAEPIGLAPAPVTPPVPSPRTPDVAEEQQSMEAELVKAAHMAEVGQTAASHVNQVDSRSHVEPNLPNLPTLSASMKQPQVAVKPKPPRQVRHQPEPMQPDVGSAPVRPQSSGGEGSTLADKYMQDWQPTGRYKCKFCHYSSVTQNFLFRHWVMSHSGVKPYLCAFCNLKSPTKDGITRHQTAKHKELPREVLIDVEQEKLLVRKFRKVFTSLVPYRYHDYGEDEAPSDAETSGIDDHNSTEEGDQREVLSLNSYGKSHENSKGITETYIYPNSHVPDENAHPGNSGDRVHGIPRIAQQCEANQLHRDSFPEGQRPNETRSYPVLKKKIRESFEGEKDAPEDMRIRPAQQEFPWPNEEPTSRLSELAGIALSSQAPPPHTLETDNNKRLLNESHEKKNLNPSVVTSSTVRPPIAIHPALQRPQMMLPPLDTLIRPQMLQHQMASMVHPARTPYMSLPSHFVPTENQPMNMYDKDMLQSAMAKHKDAQTIVQLLVSQKRDLPPDLQLPGSRKVESSMPNLVPQPPPAHQHGSHNVPFSTVAHSAPHSTFVPAMSPPITSYALSDSAHVGLPTMAGMLKSPVITIPNKIPEAGPYRDLPHLVLQKTHTTAGSLPPINELRSSASYSGVGSTQPVPSSSAPRASSVSSTSATAVLLAAAAAAKSEASTPEQDHTVETTSETMSSSPHVTSTSEEPVDGNANKTSSEDLQLKTAPVKIQTIDVPHSNPSPDQSQDAVKTMSDVNSTLQVTSS